MRGCGFCAETEERAAQGTAPAGCACRSSSVGGSRPRRLFPCQAAGRHPAIKRLVALRI